MKIKKVLYSPSQLRPLIYQQHLQTQQRTVYYRHNIHLGPTPRPRIHNTKIRRWFQSWGLAVRRMTPGSVSNRFDSRFLFWLSILTNPRIKVRVFIIWRDRIQQLVIWIRSTGFVMCPAFKEPTIWDASWTTAGYTRPIDSTKDPCTCCGLFEEGIEGWPLKLQQQQCLSLLLQP